MAISLERSSLFGSPFRAHFWPIFGPILGSILVRFAVLGPDPAITTGAPFSTRKHEDFAEVFNKIPEFYRAKRPSISVLSRRNRPPCTCLKKYRKHMVFARIAARMCKNRWVFYNLSPLLAKIAGRMCKNQWVFKDSGSSLCKNPCVFASFVERFGTPLV